MSQFQFLDKEWPDVASAAVFSKARVITQLGNQAVHSTRPIQRSDALMAVRELFHVSYWLARTYGRTARPAPGLAFDAPALPRSTIPKQTIEQLQKLEAGLRERDEKLSVLLADKSALDEELKRLHAEVAEAKKAELELMIQRRSSRKSLTQAEIDNDIVERYYQLRSIRRIAEAFERDNDRKALVVMATGAGKTRTVIALSELLMRCNWAKRVLFLADGVALVNQAVNAFKRHLPDAAPVRVGMDHSLMWLQLQV